MPIPRLSGLSLPTLGGSSSSLLDGFVPVVQQTVNYATTSAATKVTESLVKLADTGITKDFSKLSSKVGLSNTATTTAVTDAITGQQLLKFAVPGGPASLLEPIADTTDSIKVKLTSVNFGEVVFTVMPTIDEGQSAEYSEFTPLHHPGAILKYRRTSARSWTISAKLIARNATEANANLETINRIRGWVMPQYGIRTANNPNAVLGAPPPVLTLSAYGNRVIGPVKCVLESFRWQFNNDVDYLPTRDINDNGLASDQAPFPAIIDVTLSLKESWSPAEFSNFDLGAYVNGRLTGENGAFFARRTENTQRNTSSAPVSPSSIDNQIAGNNALRRIEVSQAKDLGATDIYRNSASASTESSNAAGNVADFASGDGVFGA